VTAPPAADLDRLFEGTTGSGPGLVAAVAKDGHLVYRRAFGMASIEHAVANTPATRMRIGSTTKQFACMVTLLLQEEGLLDLDEMVHRLLPELPELAGYPTLRQLMTHSSGYRDYLDISVTAGGMRMQPLGTALATQVRQNGVNFRPGHGQIYCNGGYHLLSIALERASRRPFGKLLKERLFDPVGMSQTELVPSDMALVAGLAAQHVADPAGGWRRGIFPSEEVLGEGGVVSTVDDMLRWVSQLRGPKRIVGSPESWRQLMTPATLANGLPTPYALGLNRHLHRGIEVIHHGGVVIGGKSQMLTVPEHALDIVIHVNGASVDPVKTGMRVVDILLARHVRGPVTPKMAKSRGLDHLFGRRWHGDSGMVIGFDDLEGTLGFSFLQMPAFPVLRDEGRTLRLGFEDAGVGPMVLDKADLRPGDDGGPPRALPYNESGRREMLRLLPKRPPSTPKAGVPLAGRFRCPDFGAEASLALEGANLVLRLVGVHGERSITLEALSNDVFAGTTQESSAPGFVLTVERRTSARVDAFRVNTMRTRDVRFERIDFPGEPKHGPAEYSQP
jgi:CubicO group peptidase (beta-lactamase class C family)